jgi:hypothetical protein
VGFAYCIFWRQASEQRGVGGKPHLFHSQISGVSHGDGLSGNTEGNLAEAIQLSTSLPHIPGGQRQDIHCHPVLLIWRTAGGLWPACYWPGGLLGRLPALRPGKGRYRERLRHYFGAEECVARVLDGFVYLTFTVKNPPFAYPLDHRSTRNTTSTAAREHRRSDLTICLQSVCGK